MHSAKKIKRIGLFDSGVGGLTVLKELLDLPLTDFIYIADSANAPYGQKTPEQILQFSTSITQFLVTQKIDALVIACHTSSALALPHLQKMFPELLIIGTIIQTMLHTTQQTKNGRIGIMATQASINSHLHKKELLTINPELDVFEVACPKLVPLIETSEKDMQQIEDALQEYLLPLIAQKIDTLILGCTHYPLLAQEIKKIVGDEITLVASEKIIAQTLGAHCIGNSEQQKNITFYATDAPEVFAQKAQLILGAAVAVTHLDLNTYSHSEVESQLNLSNTIL